MQTRFGDGNAARAGECDESGARVDECARRYRAQHLRVLIMGDEHDARRDETHAVHDAPRSKNCDEHAARRDGARRSQ
jgi:hypothetical protein